MIRLDTTTRKLQILLGAAVTTSESSVIVCYSDKFNADYPGGTKVSNTNGSTAVDICDAPSIAGVQRDIDYIAFRYRDTVSGTVTFRYNDNGTTYEDVKFDLNPGDKLTYTHASGWSILTSSGALKTAVAGVNATVDVFSGDNSTTAFVLTNTPASKQSTFVTISGVMQQKSTYSISGSTLTFSTAPATGTSNIEVVTLATVGIGVPGDGTVTSAKLDTNISIAGTLTVGGTMTVTNGEIVYGAAQTNIRANTSDGADSSFVTLCGGGNSLSSRGAIVAVYGNEHANTGRVRIFPGSASGAYVSVYNSGGVENLRITEQGMLKASPSGGFLNSTSGYHELRGTTAGQELAYLSHGHASNPIGIAIFYDGAAPNDTGHLFIDCIDSSTNRMTVRANGGIANFQANNVNLSDATVKSSILTLRDSPTLLTGLWNAHRDTNWSLFKYKDQTHDDPNMGYIAQDVREKFAAVAPWLVGAWDDGKEDSPLAVYSEDLHNIGHAVLAAAQARIEQLEARLAQLESR